MAGEMVHRGPEVLPRGFFVFWPVFAGLCALPRLEPGLSDRRQRIVGAACGGVFEAELVISGPHRGESVRERFTGGERV
jgi:hypothetical protein